MHDLCMTVQVRSKLFIRPPNFQHRTFTQQIATTRPHFLLPLKSFQKRSNNLYRNLHLIYETHSTCATWKLAKEVTKLLRRACHDEIGACTCSPLLYRGEYTYILPPPPCRIRKTFNPLHPADFLSSASMAPSSSEVPTTLAYQNGRSDPLCFCELNDELVAVWARDTLGLQETDNRTIPLLHLP
jgi:hypothetical protein